MNPSNPSFQTERRQFLRSFLLLNLTAAAVCLIFWLAVRFKLPFFNNPCPWAEYLHLYCTGCGGTRAFFALLHGDLLLSLRYHPVVVLGGLLILYYEVRAVCALVSGDIQRFFGRVRHRLVVAYVITLLAYTVIRDLLLVIWGIDLIGDLAAFY